MQVRVFCLAFFFCLYQICFFVFFLLPGSVSVVRLKTILLPCMGYNIKYFIRHNSNSHLRHCEHRYAFSTEYFATIHTSTFVRIYAVWRERKSLTLFRSKTTLKIKAILLCKTVFFLYLQAVSADLLIYTYTVDVVLVFALGGFISSVLLDVLYIKM